MAEVGQEFSGEGKGVSFGKLEKQFDARGCWEGEVGWGIDKRLVWRHMS